jgi:hypothetical protein
MLSCKKTEKENDDSGTRDFPFPPYLFPFLQAISSLPHFFPHRICQIDNDSNDEADSHTSIQNNSEYDSRFNTISAVTAKKILTLPSIASDEVQ